MKTPIDALKERGWQPREVSYSSLNKSGRDGADQAREVVKALAYGMRVHSRPKLTLLLGNYIEHFSNLGNAGKRLRLEYEHGHGISSFTSVVFLEQTPTPDQAQEQIALRYQEFFDGHGDKPTETALLHIQHEDRVLASALGYAKLDSKTLQLVQLGFVSW